MAQTKKTTRVATPKTNRQVLTKAIKDLSDIDLVFLRERILRSCDEVISNKQQILEDMKYGWVKPELFIESMERIKDKIDF
jgi:hypothetical protein